MRMAAVSLYIKQTWFQNPSWLGLESSVLFISTQHWARWYNRDPSMAQSSQTKGQTPGLKWVVQRACGFLSHHHNQGLDPALPSPGWDPTDSNRDATLCITCIQILPKLLMEISPQWRVAQWTWWFPKSSTMANTGKVSSWSETASCWYLKSWAVDYLRCKPT